MNPFELARAEFYSRRDAGEVCDAVDAVLRDGFVSGEAHYRVFGRRNGRAFRMSLGLPLLGGGTPVLRARIRDGLGPAVLDVRVGARHEFTLFIGFWGLLTVLGGGYQVWLQLRRVLAGEATWSAVREVLPGIGVMALLVFAGVTLWRRRQRAQAYALIELLRQRVGAALPLSVAPAPIS